MSDLISKQKAIDEIRAFQEQVTLSGSSDWINGMDEGFDHAVSVIELMDTVDAIPIDFIMSEIYVEESVTERTYASFFWRELIELWKALKENWK